MTATIPKGFHPEPFSYHQELELDIDALSNAGDGIGRVDGWVVFVPFALPGDRVKARVWRNDKNYSSADLVEIINPSPDRVEPGCRLFGTCGGCQYQHLSYDRQLLWKTRQVADLLRLQAGLELPVNPAIASPRQYHYRSKITPHFDKPKEGGKPAIGFLKAGSRRDVVDVPQCPIAMECINEALPLARKSVYQAAARFKRGATILLRASEGTVITNNNAVACERVGNLEFHFLAGDFFQNNPFILPLFTDYVAQQASMDGEEFLVDAYCGSGLFALSLAKKFKKVLGVEVSETSADWARSNARSNGIEQDDVRLILAVRHGVALLHEHAGHLLGVPFVHLAAVSFDVKLGHGKNQVFFFRVTTHSKCLVWGNRSKGWTAVTAYPALSNSARSRIWVAGLQET